MFTLGITGLGSETGIGASYIIMSIVGAALLPPLTGLISEMHVGIQHSMVVPLWCLAICAAYALAAPKLIAADAEEEAGQRLLSPLL